MTNFIAGPCLNFLSKTIETCKSQKAKLAMERNTLSTDVLRRERERLLRQREGSEERQDRRKDGYSQNKPREFVIQSDNESESLLDTKWLLKEYRKKRHVFNILCIGEDLI